MLRASGALARVSALARHVTPALRCLTLERVACGASLKGPDPMNSPRLAAHQETVAKVPVPSLPEACFGFDALFPLDMGMSVQFCRR